MTAILIIAPLVLAALAIMLVGEEHFKTVKYIAFGASIVTLLFAILLYQTPPGIETYSWFSIAGLSFNITTSTETLNMLLMMLVSVMTPLIFLYSMGYLETPSEQRRFYFEMCLFAASMLLFSISAGFISLFIAWEMLGVTSYLLIGFWYKREHAATAARKAITTILIGDIAMLVAIVLIGVHYHSFDFATLMSQYQNTSFLYLPLLLILIAAFTKSAQFPFHEWLSDAMEGPTPVSAFLHSSTMVKAGVFLIMVLFPLYSQTGLLPVILIVGIISAAIGASNALASRHIKKILAYSTIEDLALMFIGIGLGALYATILLFFVQSFYKALLFMGSGAIMKANEDEEDIFKTYNSSKNRKLYVALLFGVLSIAGVFPFSGFFGKALLGSAASSNLPVYIMLVIIELAGGIYIFRWLFIPLRNMNEKEETVYINYNSIPPTMIAPMYILAILILLASFSYIYFPTFLLPIVKNVQQITWPEVLFVNGTAIVGLLVANYVYRQGHRFYMASKHKNLFNALNNSAIINRAYVAIAAAFMYTARAISRFDSGVDKFTYSFSEAFIESGHSIKGLVNGQVNTYLLAFIAGFIILVIAFAL